MSDYTATVRWSRDGARFTDNRYSRVHRWSFDGGIDVRASASPLVVPLPLSSAEAVDPEEAYVAALSSCHMLFFLSLAAKQGLVVDAYFDQARGRMEKDPSGKLAMTRIVLRPEVRFDGNAPDARTIADLHHRAHEECFLARSVKTEIIVEPESPAA
ncbi:MAG: OsmC family protein [Thermoanaerobaculia bacterium]|nr:OsmC family protein [Thermoanaerobaculia bacterium]